MRSWPLTIVQWIYLFYESVNHSTACPIWMAFEIAMISKQEISVWRHLVIFDALLPLKKPRSKTGIRWYVFRSHPSICCLEWGLYRDYQATSSWTKIPKWRTPIRRPKSWVPHSFESFKKNSNSHNMAGIGRLCSESLTLYCPLF
jgi:hypothetical protein